MHDFQSTFMGDVVFRQSATISLSVTVAGPNTYTWSETVDAGTWFPSAYELVRYMVSGWNTLLGGDMEVSLVTDPSNSDYQKIAITPDGGFGTITSLVLTVPEIWADLGFSSAAHDFGSGNSVKYSGRVPYVLTPYWPISQYELGVENLTGYSEAAHDGSVYSIAGTTQRTLSLNVALDRSSNFDETVLWMQLWRDRWSRGRAVVFYLDNKRVPAAGASWNPSFAHCDVIEIPANTPMTFQRMMDTKEWINYTQSIQFIHRRVRTNDFHQIKYNTQMSDAPLSTPRVSSWYRAVIGDYLDLDFDGIPDDTNCSVAFWFKLKTLPTTGCLIDASWGDLIEAVRGIGDTYTLRFDGAGYPVTLRLGEYNHLVINSIGGTITYRVNGVPISSSFVGALGNFSLSAEDDTSVTDYANIGVFFGSQVSEGESSALYNAGVTFDYADVFGLWGGREPDFYWCGAVSPSNVIPNSSTTHIHGDVYYNSGTPIWGNLVT